MLTAILRLFERYTHPPSTITFGARVSLLWAQADKEDELAREINLLVHASLLNFYGATECSFVTLDSISPFGALPRFGWLAEPCLGVESRCGGPNALIVSIRRRGGSLFVRRHMTFSGYMEDRILLSRPPAMLCTADTAVMCLLWSSGGR